MTLPTYTVSGRTDWSLIPEHMIGGMRRYIEQGIEPGDFLFAILSNDLKGAVERADDINRKAIGDYVMFLYNYAPSHCWGSLERVRVWMEHKGLYEGKEVVS